MEKRLNIMAVHNNIQSRDQAERGRKTLHSESAFDTILSISFELQLFKTRL